MRHGWWVTLALLGCGDATMDARMTALEQRVQRLEAKTMSTRESQEKEVVGKDATLDGLEWMSGTATLDGSKATVLVFFETWCPHCKREMPELQTTYAKLKSEGLQVVGVTQLTRKTTPEMLAGFIDEHGLEFPIGKDDGKLGKHYAVTGVPAAAIVKDGKIVWRGAAAKLSEPMIQSSMR